MDGGPLSSGRSLDRPSVLDWTVFADPSRSAMVEGIDRAALAGSATLQRVVDLAAALAGTRYAQISLIGDVQYVAVGHGVDPISDSVPIEESLCSVTMAAAQPLIIDDALTHPLVMNLPPVASGTVGAYLGLPLRSSEGQMLGALCVYDDHSTHWPHHLAGALEDLLTFAVTEIEQQIATSTAHVASLHRLTSVIQRIVAPPPVTVPLGVELVGRYQAADVGGDWYEWMSLDDESVAITIGDVAGHGLPAVATMARLMAHVRAYVFEGHDPGETLRLASKAFQDSGQMATVFDARYRPATHQFSYASAGHAPPLVLRNGGAFFADLAPGPPIGFGIVAPRTHALALERGDTVVICTDGLYEQRRIGLDESLEALRRMAIEIAGQTSSLEDLADALLRIPLSDTRDDTCLVVLRA